MAISTTLANNILDTICKSGTLSTHNLVYMGLSVGEPAADGTVTEVSGSGYARVPIWISNQTLGQTLAPAANGVITNNKEIHFPESTSSWGSGIAYACLFTAATGGKAFAWGTLGSFNGGSTWTASPISVDANKVVVIKAGDLQISIT